MWGGVPAIAAVLSVAIAIVVVGQPGNHWLVYGRFAGYYWTREDQADPSRLKPFTADLQSLSHCLIANSERLRAILPRPGNRSAGLTSLPRYADVPILMLPARMDAGGRAQPEAPAAVLIDC
jgi:hypothetical protein